MYKIGYVSLTAVMAMQEKLLQEGSFLNLWWPPEKNIPKAKESYGINKKYFGNIKVYQDSDFESFIKDSDFIYCDYSTPRKVIYKIRKLCKLYNKRCINANNNKAVSLETNRTLAHSLASNFGLDSVPIISFKEKEKFIKYIKTAKHKVVIKAIDDTNAILATYIPTCNDDAIYMAEKDNLHMFRHKGLIVEPFHDNCNEIFFGMYFNGFNFNNKVLINQEYKHAFPGCLGSILTGEIGSIHKWEDYTDKKFPKKFRDIIKSVEKYLLDNFEDDFRGFIDIALMIDKKKSKIYLMEFTVRPGMPTEPQVTTSVNSFSDFLAWQAYYKSSNFDNYKEDYFVYGSLYTYGTPYIIEDVSGIYPKVLGTENLKNGYIPMYIFYDEKGDIRHRCEDRIVLVYGKGSNVKIARKEYIEEITKLSTWHGVYRTDIADRWVNINNLL